MFTGIIEELGRVESIELLAHGARLRIACTKVLSDAFEGSSIAVNGVCLTALDLQPDSFAAELAPETLARTSLKQLQVGSPVNLERPLLATGRLSGHIVQGHVDGTGEILSYSPIGDGNWWLTVRCPRELLKYCVPKGSICLDGISLTIAALEGDQVSVTILPFTHQATALNARKAGDVLNIEADVIGKFVERLTAFRDE